MRSNLLLISPNELPIFENCSKNFERLFSDFSSGVLLTVAFNVSSSNFSSSDNSFVSSELDSVFSSSKFILAMSAARLSLSVVGFSSGEASLTSGSKSDPHMLHERASSSSSISHTGQTFIGIHRLLH